jgi:glycosyltransferase involved in cell wall biosynthesis
MKIGMVAPLFESCPPKLYGGTERVVDNLCKGLTELGHEVFLFASQDSNTKAKLVPIVKEALRLANPPVNSPYPYITLQIATVLDHANSLDIIHNHIDFHPFPYVDRSNCPWLTTLHGRLDLMELKSVFKHFNHLPLTSISFSQRTPLANCNWVGNVYHGIDLDTFKPNYQPGKYLAFLGRICADKGIDKAIEIAHQSGIPLKIAAKVDAADKEYYEQEIKHLIDGKHIEYIGEITEHEKSDFLGNAYALLTPINWPEPFGLVVIEAYACGTPVIGRPMGSLPEIVHNEKTGYLRQSIDDLVQAVNSIDQLDRKAVRRFAEDNFSYKYMAERYVSLYHKLTQLPLPNMSASAASYRV